MEQQENVINGGITPSKVKGGYVLGSTDKLNTLTITLPFKPKWLHRQMMRIFFGWYWVDAK